jgi:hypothetical protein
VKATPLTGQVEALSGRGVAIDSASLSLASRSRTDDDCKYLNDIRELHKL